MEPGSRVRIHPSYEDDGWETDTAGTVVAGPINFPAYKAEMFDTYFLDEDEWEEWAEMREADVLVLFDGDDRPTPMCRRLLTDA